MDAEHSGGRKSTGPHHAFLGVGSNQDPEKSILSGLLLLRKILPILDISRFYQTLPVGSPSRPLFIKGNGTKKDSG
jgi:7,8-dihydro-6-hydroxymethylpterin-pyrophosphokinase